MHSTVYSSQVSFATASNEATSTLSTSYGSALVSDSLPSGPAPVSGVSSLGVAPAQVSGVSSLGVATGHDSSVSAPGAATGIDSSVSTQGVATGHDSCVSQGVTPGLDSSVSSLGVAPGQVLDLSMSSSFSVSIPLLKNQKNQKNSTF